MTPTRRPLVNIGLQPLSSTTTRRRDDSFDSDEENHHKSYEKWLRYAPLCGTIFLMLLPHPSILIVLINFHLRTLSKPNHFLAHLISIYTLAIMGFSSMIVCVTRNPGVAGPNGVNDPEEEVGVTDALMQDEDFLSPGRWCRKCSAPKPERTHHCSTCGCCVLKMDHHCPWLGSRCIGHRTYPAFLHFLGSITLLAIYLAVINVNAIWYAFNNPFGVDPTTPLHELFLAFFGMIITLVIGSFFCYHLYLVSTNQTTLEHISPFLLLKYLPRLPPSGHSLSDPPLEPELSGPQRRLVRDAHRTIHMYDVGWKKNWAQVLGLDIENGWFVRLCYGGASPGDGKHFPKNPQTETMLAKLATELVKLDRNY